MISVRTNPTIGAAEGAERTRTAVCDLSAFSAQTVRSGSKAYRARRALWGQSTLRGRAVGSGGPSTAEQAVTGTACSGERRIGVAPDVPHLLNERRVSWTGDTRRLLHLVFAVLAVLAVAGAFAPPFFGAGS